jgi:subtilisin family serine protease
MRIIKILINLIVIIFLFLYFKPMLASEAYEPNTLIVKTKAINHIFGVNLKKESKLSKKIKAITNLKVLKNEVSLQGTGEEYLKYQFEDNADLKILAEELEALDWVEYAEPNYYVYAFSMPEDPYLNRQDYIVNTNLKGLFEIPNNNEVIVAVLDSGVDYTHKDLAPNMFVNNNEIAENGIDDDGNGYVDDVNGYNFTGLYKGQANNDPQDIFGHGTHIAGIIGAANSNELGIAGINHNVKILNVKFLDSSGRGTVYEGAQAIKYAVKMGARIINCSWGYFEYSSVLKEAIDEAISKGVIIVGAGGNLGYNIKEYPAAYENVMGVASIKQSLERSSFSSYGEHIDFSTFGQNIYSTLPDNTYSFKSGTSQSAAIISGIISKILGYNSEFNLPEVYSILKLSAVDINTNGYDRYTGYGYIDANKLYNVLTNEPLSIISSIDLKNNSESSFYIRNVLNFPNPFGMNGTKFQFESSGGELQIKIYSMYGKLVKTLSDISSSGYSTIAWDGTDESGCYLNNGTYFYIALLNSDGQTKKVKGKLSIIN